MNRHFKKYYFYFIARLFELLGRYEKSIAYYSKIIQIRTFFWDVQKRYSSVCQKSSKKFFLEIHGGLGDFLQFLPFALENKSENYIVVSYFPYAKNFFEYLNIRVKKFYYYSNKEEYYYIKEKLKMKKNSYWSPRNIFFQSFPFQKNSKFLFKNSFVVGIHAGSSKLTNKPLTREFLKKIIDSLLDIKVKIILFGTKSEIDKLSINSHKDIYLACDDNVIKNLTLVSECNIVLGSESVFKTMSSMLKITTILLHENYKNNFRDRVFVNPYVKTGVMHVFKYRNLKGKEIDLATKFSLDIVKAKLSMTA